MGTILHLVRVIGMIISFSAILFGPGIETACLFPSVAVRLITTFTRSCTVRGSLENSLRYTAQRTVDSTLRGYMIT